MKKKKKKKKKNYEKLFYLEEKCIWIGYVKLSLLSTEYLSSIVNVLKNSLKTWMPLREIFYNLITFTVSNKYGMGAVVEIETVFQSVYHVAFRGVLWNETS